MIAYNPIFKTSQLATKHLGNLVCYGKDLYPKYLSAPIRVITDFLDGAIKSKQDNIESITDHQKSFDDMKFFQLTTFSKLHYPNNLSFSDFKRSVAAATTLMELERTAQAEFPKNKGYDIVDGILADIRDSYHWTKKELVESIAKQPLKIDAYQQANKFLEKFKDHIMNGVPFYEMKNIFEGKSFLQIVKFLRSIGKPVIEMNRLIDKMAKFLTRDLDNSLIRQFNQLFENEDKAYSAEKPSKKNFVRYLKTLTQGINKLSVQVN